MKLSSSLAGSTGGGPQPTRFFDPWNSSSTGHQRAENNRLSGSTSWRQSQNLKLSAQYRGGLGGGGKRVADTVGAGSEDFGKDGRKANGGWEKGAKGLRGSGQKSLAEVWGAGKVLKSSSQEEGQMKMVKGEDSVDTENTVSVDEEPEQQDDGNPRPKQIFDHLVFYLNGSTAPLVSDHKLKQLLAERGGKMSIGLGRRSVTHVILGSASGAGGCGGGLASSKIQKEIARVGGKGVKFIAVDWVLTSIALNQRQPEARFSPLHLAAKGQTSVYTLFNPKSTSKSHFKPTTSKSQSHPTPNPNPTLNL
ncbi:hypothetical protein P154DRAFT_433191 [Amniculicola lignicola CBS 123094]|uniref:BRCT domain-containing protein n=1 Tax=Amniculicola lignicola CBS 123094 TaxID=1392246 RepID=A0A6A5WIC7_9PLEO|nr:hypothetical protein P154DRAFT_433191 [Amniculicola lignicola CBS 123094]